MRLTFWGPTCSPGRGAEGANERPARCSVVTPVRRAPISSRAIARALAPLHNRDGSFHETPPSGILTGGTSHPWVFPGCSEHYSLTTFSVFRALASTGGKDDWGATPFGAPASRGHLGRTNVGLGPEAGEPRGLGAAEEVHAPMPLCPYAPMPRRPGRRSPDQHRTRKF